MTSVFLRNLIGEDAASTISGLATEVGEQHPSWSAILHAEDGQGQPVDQVRTSHSIEQALRSFSKSDKAWLSPRLIERLMAQNFADAASALGEIRAYGALMDAFGSKVSGVPTGKSPTPDFLVRNRNDYVYPRLA
ncbi:hypothetical protein [Paraburkholderia pallida]|uniref:Uncharacterized protein n=1 Tax=Paraburkholderia pallida TaxID=2547399 RepID=A0A4P7D6J1_9BURK|nr:hypothetical protein [Paraburkholderia pallida]QBR02465.1 hypothetical protein E1956_35025 [Paraburkholderia pallida]